MDAKHRSLEKGVQADHEVSRIERLVTVSQNRREDSRRKLLGAALALIGERGYSAVNVEDITKQAGVSRLTFYRHFATKSEIASHLYKVITASTVERMVSIGGRDYRDPATVTAWIREQFAVDVGTRHLHGAFSSAYADAPALQEAARQTIRDIIEGLGRRIARFRCDPEQQDQHRSWTAAYLLLFQILDQSRHAALGTAHASDPAVTEILANQFVAFVEGRFDF